MRQYSSQKYTSERNLYKKVLLENDFTEFKKNVYRFNKEDVFIVNPVITDKAITVSYEKLTKEKTYILLKGLSNAFYMSGNKYTKFRYNKKNDLYFLDYDLFNYNKSIHIVPNNIKYIVNEDNTYNLEIVFSFY